MTARNAKKAWISALLFTALCMAGMPARATESSVANALDHRVRTIMYQPDEVYKYVGIYGFGTSIEFAADETIQIISMGDATAWMLQPSGSRLFLKPVEQGATTNMTLITNKRTYLFELHAQQAQDINDPNVTFILRFIYPAEGGTVGSTVQNLDPVPLPDLDRHPERYNTRYTISGPEATAPIRIFDDGKFTYFQFRNRNADVPAFFWVDSGGNESLINYRTRGDFIVVERVTARFTLRYGSNINCVFNEAFPKQLEVKPDTNNHRDITGGSSDSGSGLAPHL